MNLCRRLTASTSSWRVSAPSLRSYATRYPRPKPGTSERPAYHASDPLVNNPQAVVTPLQDEDLTFIHRPPPSSPSPFSLTTNPSSPLLRPPTEPVTNTPLPPLMRKQQPAPERASDEVVAEIRRLRHLDPDTYTRQKLCEMFGVTRNFIGAIAALKPSKRKSLMRTWQAKVEKKREGWSERKITAHAIRAKRREHW